jgi:hypothetical protein
MACEEINNFSHPNNAATNRETKQAAKSACEEKRK